MKKEELRIGNWYRSVKFGVPVKCDLTDFYNLSANADGADDDPPIDEMFTPIPLTRKWLEESGIFERFGFDSYKSMKYTFTSDFITHPTDWFYIKFITYRSYGKLPCVFKYGHLLRPVLYIHQLQNLYFALTGNELL